MLMFIIIHFYLTPNIKELNFIIMISIIGTIIDSGLLISGVIGYKGLYHQNIYIAPLWITAMWAGFSATANHSMAWLKGQGLLALLLGAIFGPLAYITGLQFNVIFFHLPFMIVSIILAITWAISIYMIFYINEKLGL